MVGIHHFSDEPTAPTSTVATKQDVVISQMSIQYFVIMPCEFQISRLRIFFCFPSSGAWIILKVEPYGLLANLLQLFFNHSLITCYSRL